jgi:putative holliday junction resolvase
VGVTDAVAAVPGRYNRPFVKVLALDYGSARTGVAISDPSGTLARPLDVVERAGSESGLRRIAKLVEAQEVDRVVVGMPITLSGEHGAQALETDAFVESLRAAVAVPVETFDERFTTRLAHANPSRAAEDAVAAAHLLTGYLAWTSNRPA